MAASLRPSGRAAPTAGAHGTGATHSHRLVGPVDLCHRPADRSSGRTFWHAHLPKVVRSSAGYLYAALHGHSRSIRLRTRFTDFPYSVDVHTWTNQIDAEYLCSSHSGASTNSKRRSASSGAGLVADGPGIRGGWPWRNFRVPGSMQVSADFRTGPRGRARDRSAIRRDHDY